MVTTILAFAGCNQPVDKYKLKVDGSVSAFNKEAVGDVFRDSNGQLLFSYAADIGSCTQLL